MTPPPRRPAARAATALLALAAAVGALAVVPDGAASAADSIGISGAPSANGVPDGRTRFSYQVQPGQRLEDEYTVRNTGTTTQEMTVFGTDAFTTVAGDWGLLATSREPVDVGAWVRFEGRPRTALTLAPGQSTTVRFAIEVPADAGPGDHAGGIVVSTVSPEGQVLVDRRVATRLYVRVPGAIQAALTVSSMAASYRTSWNPFDGDVVVRLSVRNTGNVALGGLAVVGTRTWFGFGLTKVERPQVAELLPGSVRKLTVTLRGIPALGYLEPYVTLVPTISPDAIQPPSLVTAKRSTSIVAVPWLVLGILLALALVLGGGALRRRADRRRADAWIAHVEREAREAAADAPESAAVAPTSGARR